MKIDKKKKRWKMVKISQTLNEVRQAHRGSRRRALSRTMKEYEELFIPMHIAVVSCRVFMIVIAENIADCT